MGALQQALESGKFGVTAEMAPPKGHDFTECMEAAEMLKGKVHGINVTDMQSACLKASSIGLCIKLKQAGLDPIIQMTGRDRSRMAIMGDFLAAAAFGIDTMLALTGDHTVVGDCKNAPYGLTVFLHCFLNSSLIASFIAFSILTWSASQFITLLDFSLPFCLSPISIVGTLRAGASIIPLDELPNTNIACMTNDKYLTTPNEEKTCKFSIFLLASSNIELIIFPP